MFYDHMRLDDDCARKQQNDVFILMVENLFNNHRLQTSGMTTTTRESMLRPHRLTMKNVMSQMHHAEVREM